FADGEGRPTGYGRLKPDRPRKDKNGKAIKYESPVGTGNLPYFPCGTLAVLKNASHPIIITEGEKKAAKADQEGFPCIGLVGVYGWQTKAARDKDGKVKGERPLIPDLKTIPWQGRSVSIVYDSDAAGNRNVLWGEGHLAAGL